MSRSTLPDAMHRKRDLPTLSSFACFDHYRARNVNICLKPKKSVCMSWGGRGEIVFYYCFFFFFVTVFVRFPEPKSKIPRGLRDFRCDNAQQIRINNVWRLSQRSLAGFFAKQKKQKPIFLTKKSRTPRQDRFSRHRCWCARRPTPHITDRSSSSGPRDRIIFF